MEATADSHGVAEGEGLFLAWIGAAVVNAATIATLPLPRGGLGVRALHHVYDAGQLVAFGLLSWAAVALWRRYGARRFRGLVAASGAAVAVGLFVLPTTLHGVAERIGFAMGYAADADPEPQLTIITVLLSLTIPVTAAVASRLARPRWRPIAIAIAVSLWVGNEWILDGESPGVHFFAAWNAVVLAGVALQGVVLPARLRVRSWRRRWRAIVGAGLLTFASLTVSLWPSHAVSVELFKLDGAVIAPHLARLRAALRAAVRRGSGGSTYVHGVGAWVPASTPSLLPERPIVILLTMDAVRADTYAQREHRRGFPNLVELQRESVDFTHTRATSSGTRYSMSGVFAGRYWSQLPWANPSSIRPVITEDPSHRLPNLLSEAGVQTVNIVVEYRGLVAASGIVGVFDEETVLMPERRGKYDFVTASDAMDAAIPRLLAQDDRPLFLFLHLIDAHYPYDLGGTDGSAKRRWIGEIRYLDGQIGRLRTALEEAGLWDRVVMIVSSDHGEGLGQHGCKTHNCNLYEELIRVPLFIRIPGIAPFSVDTPISQIDLGPTILDLFGVSTPPEFVGESLVPFLRGEQPERHNPIAAEHVKMIAWVTADNFKVIVDDRRQREEIYDLTSDPAETDNLRDTLGDRGDALVHELRDYFHTLSPYSW